MKVRVHENFDEALKHERATVLHLAAELPLSVTPLTYADAVDLRDQLSAAIERFTWLKNIGPIADIVIPE